MEPLSRPELQLIEMGDSILTPGARGSQDVQSAQAMKQIDIAKMSIAQLLERFTSVALAQNRAMIMSDSAKFNRLFDEMQEIKKALKGRSGNQRRTLIPLYSHSNAQVRYAAAVATVGLERELARQVLELISDRHEFP
jgi:Domain of unknown function (DUF2019)